MGTYTAQPSPTPTGTSSNTGSYAPQPAPAPSVSWSGDTWNQIWNDYWNKGFNRQYGTSYSGSGTYGDAQTQGYLAGLSEYNKRNSTAVTSPTNTVTNNTQPTSPTGPTGPSEQDLINQERDRIMSEISGGYDSYLSQLTSTLENDLPAQQGTQNQIIQNNLNTGLQNLDLQKQSGEFDLAKESATNVSNQVRTLKDVSSNIRNLMQAGNTYLGGKGAGDSSATSQYTYALTKLGSKQRGDVMSQSRNIEADIQARKWKLTNAYNQEVNKLRNETANKALEVSSWFNEQQNNVRLMIAQGKLNKGVELANLSKQILQDSMSKLALLQQEQANKESMLKTWVLNNSTSIAQAQTMWNQMIASKNQQIKTNPINGNIAMNGLTTQMPKYGGYSGYDDEDSLF